MRAHVNMLGAKNYWNQFDDTPDFVVMFVPGEHFLAAALDQDHELWDYAFERKVLLATPTNLIAIARPVAAVWRRSEESRVGTECGSTCRSRWSPYHYKKTPTQHTTT